MQGVLRESCCVHACWQPVTVKTRKHSCTCQNTSTARSRTCSLSLPWLRSKSSFTSCSRPAMLVFFSLPLLFFFPHFLSVCRQRCHALKQKHRQTRNIHSMGQWKLYPCWQCGVFPGEHPAIAGYMQTACLDRYRPDTNRRRTA